MGNFLHASNWLQITHETSRLDLSRGVVDHISYGCLASEVVGTEDNYSRSRLNLFYVIYEATFSLGIIYALS